MGDGIQKKYALILNGDTEARHLGNVDRAVQALRAEGAYDISVASPKAPGAGVERHEAPSREGLEKLLAGMKSKMDDDDLLVVYVTGHGDGGSKGEGCVSLPAECLSLGSLAADLKALSYGKRILVMDNCFSGSGFNFFADAKTTVVSQGSPGEKVSCQLFSPFFWSDQVPDADQDGKISVQERFQHAVLKGQSESLLQFYSPEPISLSGDVAARPFKTADGKPMEVADGKGLKAQLARLKAGQLALVAFSADWCLPCKKYQPHFEKLAKQDGGRVLMIHAEGRNGTEEDWAQWGVTSFPTVAFVDWNGKVVKVADIMDPMASLAVAAVHSPEEQAKILIRKLTSPDAAERYRATLGLRAMGALAAPSVPALAQALKDADADVRFGAVAALAEIGPAAAPAVPQLLPLLESKDYALVLRAVHALGKVGPKAKDAVPALLKLFRGDLEALAKKSVEGKGLNAILNGHMVFDKVFELSGEIAFALARISPGGAEPLQALVTAASDAKLDYARRYQAVTGLAAMGGSAAEATPRLIALFDEREIGSHCQTAVVKIAQSSPTTVRLLAEGARDIKQTPYQRFRFLEILGRVGAAASGERETLWKLAEDKTEDPRLRKMAALTLNKIDPSLAEKTDPLLKELEGVSLLFDAPQAEPEAAPPAALDPPRWSFSPDLEFSVRRAAAGGGFGLSAGYRPARFFELRLGTHFHGMHLPKEKVPSDFQIGFRFEPIFHLFGSPEKSGPSLTVGEIGAYHLAANGITGLYLAPLGVGYSLNLGESFQLSLSLKAQAHWEGDWKPGAAGQFGWIKRF